MLKPLIILEEELKISAGNVNFEVRPELSVGLEIWLSAREGVFLDLLFDLLGRVGQEDGRVGVAGGHLLIVALKGGKELGVHSAGLGEVQSWGKVPGHPEVGILVYSTGDETEEVLVVPEELPEGARDAGRRLDRAVGDLAAVLGSLESEDSLDLVVGDGVLQENYVVVEVAYVVCVSEKEGLFVVEAAGEDVFGILYCRL